jgi:DNA-binding HxlR family transcriptional regulator
MTVTGMDGTSSADAGAARPRLTSCRAREILHRVGDKWSVSVIDRLGEGSLRFSELRRSIGGITARMLTVTLRGMERDGLVTRTLHPVIPPRVDYELTPMGRTLLQTIEPLIDWADSHVADIYTARAAYDAKHAPEDTAGCEADGTDPCEAATTDPCEAASAAACDAADAE